MTSFINLDNVILLLMLRSDQSSHIYRRTVCSQEINVLYISTILTLFNNIFKSQFSSYKVQGLSPVKSAYLVLH